MKNIFRKENRNKLLSGVAAAVIITQSVIIGTLYGERSNIKYEVNLMPVKTAKDSIDYPAIKNGLKDIDRTVRELHAFLAAKNLQENKTETLAQDSLSEAVYLAGNTNRYSRYLADLQKKLQQVPLGIPTDGYISSAFGMRKNPIPPRTVLLASAAAKKSVPKTPQYTEEKDSLGNVIRKPVMVATDTKAAKPSENHPPAEADQTQFHKGVDIAVPYGSPVRGAAHGTVIFAGAKGGYGNCVIISHGNGLATLYGHLSEILVKTDQVVDANEVIAKTGNSGRSTGPHLHYEVHRNGTPVNPKLFLSY